MSNTSWIAAMAMLSALFNGALFAMPERSCAAELTEARTWGYIDGVRQTTRLFVVAQ